MICDDMLQLQSTMQSGLQLIQVMIITQLALACLALGRHYILMLYSDRKAH